MGSAIYGSRQPLKACLQSPAGKEKRDQTKESSNAGIGLFVTSCDASECLEMAEEVFDQMAPFVHFCIVRDALGPVGLGGNDRDCAAFVQVGTQPVVVEGLVGDQGLDTDAVVTLARQQQEANEIPECVHQGHDLGSQAAARAAYGLSLSPPFAPVPCWWTRTSVPSMRTYSKSGSSRSALKTRSQTPFCAHRQKRVYAVNHLPNASGRSRHAIQRTASIRSRRGHQLYPAAPAQSASTAHRSTSIESRLISIFSALNQFSTDLGILSVNRP